LPWESYYTLVPYQADAKRILWPVSGVNITLDSGNGAGSRAFVQACRTLPSTQTILLGNPIFCWQGVAWAGSQFTDMGDAYNHVNTPNGLSCAPANNAGNGPVSPGYNNALTASSQHRGGVMACFTDGSVRFVKDTVDLSVWWALGTRNGGETVSAGDY
jgi:hypothetical protein